MQVKQPLRSSGSFTVAFIWLSIGLAMAFFAVLAQPRVIPPGNVWSLVWRSANPVVTSSMVCPSNAAPNAASPSKVPPRRRRERRRTMRLRNELSPPRSSGEIGRRWPPPMDAACIPAAGRSAPPSAALTMSYQDIPSPSWNVNCSRGIQAG